MTSATEFVRTIFQSLFEDNATTTNLLKPHIFNVSCIEVNLLSANPTNGPLLPANCLSVFDHFVGLVLKGFIRCLLFSTIKDSGISKSEQSIVHLKGWMLVNGKSFQT